MLMTIIPSSGILGIVGLVSSTICGFSGIHDLSFMATIEKHMKDGFLRGAATMLSEWKSKAYVSNPDLTSQVHRLTIHLHNSIPPKEDWVKVEKPNWGTDANLSTWAQEIKATWLGHACFLVELPAPADNTAKAEDIGAPARGPRILFDPVFSHRCSPSQLIGPGRYTPPPMPLKELPQVDIVVLSHNHYDHTYVSLPLSPFYSCVLTCRVAM